MTQARDKANIPVLNFASKGIDDNADATAITIDSSERVGIGTTSPDAQFQTDVASATIGGGRIYTNAVRTGVNSSALFSVRADNASGSSSGDIVNIQGDGVGDLLTLNNNGTDRVTFKANGRVGIGTSNPGATLETIGTAGNNFKYATAGTYFSILPEAANGNVSLRFRANSGSAPDLIFKNDSGSEVVRIGNTGNVGIGTSNTTTAKVFVNHAGAVDDNGLYVYSNLGQTVPLVKIIQDGAGSSAPAVYIRNDDADGVVLHLEKGDSGLDAPAFANALFIEDDANTGLTIGSPTSGVGSIVFGDSGDADIGKFQYYHNDNSMRFNVNAAERMRINNAGKILINTTIDSNGNVCSSGNGTSGSTACYGLVRGSFKSTLGMSSTGGMNIRNFSGEIYVTDSGGNNTTISPHNFEVIPDGASEDLAWSYCSRKGDSENDFDNTKYISVDITKVIRKVENLTGDKLIYTGTGSTDDGSTVSQNIIQDLITRIESLEAEVTALKNQP